MSFYVYILASRRNGTLERMNPAWRDLFDDLLE
jgi:hypothetical protein